MSEDTIICLGIVCLFNSFSVIVFSLAYIWHLDHLH